MPPETHRFGAEDRLHGYWGGVTSTVDWCENNYSVIPTVAEFWNTTSNLAYVIPSLIGAVHARRKGYPFQFVLAHLSVTLVGIGSALFHATLQYEMQLLDEIPMLYCIVSLLYVVRELHSTSPNRRLAIFFTCLSSFLTLVHVCAREPNFFFAVFGFLSVLLFFWTVRAIQREPLIVPSLAVIAFGIYFLGFIVWMADNTFCKSLQSARKDIASPLSPFTQLHAWWHVLSGFGGYFVVLFYLRARLSVQGVRSYLQLPPCSLVPVLVERMENRLDLSKQRIRGKRIHV